MTSATTGRLQFLAAILALRSIGAVADVTVAVHTTVDSGPLRAHSTEIKSIAGDRERSEYELVWEGQTTLPCEHDKDIDILRLDRGLIWRIDPGSKTYIETMQDHVASVGILNSCQQARVLPSVPDTSNCDLSQPQMSIDSTRDVAIIVGHAVEKTTFAMSQSCKAKGAGELYRLVFSLDVWLTQDDIGGLTDLRSFHEAYQHKAGRTSYPLSNPALDQIMVPYAGSFKQLADVANGVKGYPLKTVFRIACAGASCGVRIPTAANSTLGSASNAAGGAAVSSGVSAAGWSADEGVQRATGYGSGGYVAGSAASAFTRSVIGGLLNKHKKPDQAPTTAAGALNTVAQFTFETTSIEATKVAPALFDLPAGIKKAVPAAAGGAMTPRQAGV